MKKLFYSILVVFVVLGCRNGKNGENIVHENNKGALIAKDNHLYIGKLSKHAKDTVGFTFDISNISDSTIVIHKTDVSCNCISLNPILKPVPPHHSVKLHGTVKLKDVSGHLSKSVFVNYGRGSLLVLRVIADVQ